MDRHSSNNGYITASATSAKNSFGILITRSMLTSTAAAKSVALGRTQGTKNRPQLSASAAAKYTSQTYLAGSDAWNPVR